MFRNKITIEVSIFYLEMFFNQKYVEEIKIHIEVFQNHLDNFDSCNYKC